MSQSKQLEKTFAFIDGLEVSTQRSRFAMFQLVYAKYFKFRFLVLSFILQNRFDVVCSSSLFINSSKFLSFYLKITICNVGSCTDTKCDTRSTRSQDYCSRTSTLIA